MSGIFQGEDVASQAEKMCRDGRAAAPGLEGDWQENTTEIPSGFWHWCLWRWNRILGALLAGQDCGRVMKD